MQIENDVKLDYSSVLLRPKRSTLSSRKQVRLERTHSFRNSKGQFQRIPIMASNMDGVGTIEMADELGTLGLFTCLVKTYSIKELVGFFTPERAEYTAYSMGITDDDFSKFRAVYTGSTIKYVCIDVANGYSERFLNFVQSVRNEYPDLTIIAGNVVTADQTQELLLRGADIVKVGIGPGSVCTTRIKTGVGYPQLSSVIECADAAHGLDGHVIADGGCTSPGDIAKAFAGGADFVMLGGMLAGHDEGGGDIITKSHYTQELADFVGNRVIEEKKFVKFYGMSSDVINKKHLVGLKDYSQVKVEKSPVLTEAVLQTLSLIYWAVSHACTYVGVTTKHLPKCATFIRCQDTHNRIYE